VLGAGSPFGGAPCRVRGQDPVGLDVELPGEFGAGGLQRPDRIVDAGQSAVDRQRGFARVGVPPSERHCGVAQCPVGCLDMADATAAGHRNHPPADGSSPQWTADDVAIVVTDLPNACVTARYVPARHTALTSPNRLRQHQTPQPGRSEASLSIVGLVIIDRPAL
jgi:hypothetical protein